MLDLIVLIALTDWLVLPELIEYPNFMDLNDFTALTRTHLVTCNFACITEFFEAYKIWMSQRLT
jgi:hypothetical protein